MLLMSPREKTHDGRILQQAGDARPCSLQATHRVTRCFICVAGDNCLKCTRHVNLDYFFEGGEGTTKRRGEGAGFGSCHRPCLYDKCDVQSKSLTWARRTAVPSILPSKDSGGGDARGVYAEIELLFASKPERCGPHPWPGKRKRR